MSNVNKTIAATVGAIGTAVSLGVLGQFSDPIAKWTAVGVSFLTILGVYKVTNTPAPPNPDDFSIGTG